MHASKYMTSTITFVFLCFDFLSTLINSLVFFNLLGQLLVIVEYCSGGNLLEYLRNKRHTSPSLTIEEQLDMCLQVSRGMEYLAFMKV